MNEMLQKSIAKNASEQLALEKILKAGFFHLKFPKKFEKDFQEYYKVSSAVQIRITLTLPILIFFVVFSIAPTYIGTLTTNQVAHFKFLLPVALAVWLFSFSRFFLSIQQVLQFLMVAIVSLGILTSAYFQASPFKELYYHSMIVVVMWALVLARFRFENSVIVGFLILGLFNFFYYFEPIRPLFIGSAQNFLLILAVLIGLSVNYFREKIARINFVGRNLIRIKNVILEELAHIDQVTGIANRRSFDIALENEFRRAKRYQYALALFIMDVDYFKQYNDAYGHQAGDNVLIKVAQSISKFARRGGDLAARLGGDEFILLLNDVDQFKVENLAENIRQTIIKLNIAHAHSPVAPCVTITIGLATLIPGNEMEPQYFYKIADMALYQAKKAGRNTFKVFQEESLSQPE